MLASSALVVCLEREAEHEKTAKKTMKMLLQEVRVAGSAKKKYLAIDAAASLKLVERDSGGLVYADLWQDGVAVFCAKRRNPDSPKPGYSSHQFGFGVDLDLRGTQEKTRLNYKELLKVMEKSFWYCYRRDEEPNLPGSEHFDYFGEHAMNYLLKATYDPIKWPRAAEERIHELHGEDFSLSIAQVQKKLGELGIYSLPISGELDEYTREAIMVFQRAWGLSEDGTASMPFCRVLSVLTVELEISPVAW
jgi:hypothetical protein